VTTEAAANRVVNDLRNQRGRTSVQPTQRAWQAPDLYGRDLKE
jgi:hypothetical protein